MFSLSLPGWIWNEQFSSNFTSSTNFSSLWATLTSLTKYTFSLLCSVRTKKFSLFLGKKKSLTAHTAKRRNYRHFVLRYTMRCWGNLNKQSSSVWGRGNRGANNDERARSSEEMGESRKLRCEILANELKIFHFSRKLSSLPRHRMDLI